MLINDDELTLEKVLENYFLQSEQIKTRIWLFADQQKASGFMLQSMPHSASESSLSQDDDEDWDRINFLADTLKPEEALELSSETILHRLFHEETVRLYPSHQHRFECTCSEERSTNAILTLGQDEALSLVEEQKLIEIDCQFCHSKYAYNIEQVKAMFSPKANDAIN